MGFGAILALILPLLSKLPGAAGDYFKKQQELKLEELKTQREVEQARQQLASEMAKAQFELNKAIVTATGTKFKYFTFVMWFGPFMLTYIRPVWSQEIFKAWQTMPHFYFQSCMVIMFAVWGISVSAPAVASIFSNLGDFFAAKREYKLEKARINRDALFAKVKSSWFPKGMTQSQVDTLDAAIDEGEK